MCDNIGNLTTFLANFFKLIDLHLPKDATLQALYLHTTKEMSLHIMFIANKAFFNLSELPYEILQDVHPHLLLIYHFI